METPTYIALSKQTAMFNDLNTIANNIANAGTNGYRGEHSMFQEYLARTGTIGQREKISSVQNIANYRDPRPGPLVQTNNELDLALHGDGYLVVGNPGQELFARTGIFHLDANRQVVTSDGYPLLQENGRPIVIPQGTQRIVITCDGTVTAQGDPGTGKLVDQQSAQIRTGGFASEQA